MGFFETEKFSHFILINILRHDQSLKRNDFDRKNNIEWVISFFKIKLKKLNVCLSFLCSPGQIYHTLKIKFANYTTLSKKLDRSIYVKTSFTSELTALSEKKLGVNIMSNSILFLLVIIESYTICMTSADIMSTRDSHLNQNKYVLPTTLCHYALKNGLK